MTFAEGSLTSDPVLPSVHLRVEEKITLTCGRDGGLQNMEVLGMITLRVSDEKNGRIRLMVNNGDKKGVQLQVHSKWAGIMAKHALIGLPATQIYFFYQPGFFFQTNI